MKVLHVIPSLGPLRGGPSLVLPVMARGLADVGVEVHVATTDDNGPSRLQVPLNTPVVRDGWVAWYFRRDAKIYTCSIGLATWLSKHVREYDLVHIHALFSYASTIAAFIARQRRVPYIVRPLGTLNAWGMANRRRRLKRISFHLVERRVLGGAAAIHYTSEDEQREAAIAGAPALGVVVPLGLPPTTLDTDGLRAAFFAEHPALAGRQIVLFMSRLDPKKGLDLLLPAFAALREAFPQAVLVIAGEGVEPYASELRALPGRLGLADVVQFHGFVAGDRKAAILAVATVFVLPSYSENFGLAAIEALAAGIPVVLSDRVGVARLAQERGAGLVVPCEIPALCDALRELLDDGELRERLGANGRAVAREHFSVEAMSRRLFALYTSVARGRG